MRKELGEEREEEEDYLRQIQQHGQSANFDFPLDQIRESRRTVATMKRRIAPFDYGDGKTLDKKTVKVFIQEDDQATYKGQTNSRGEKEGKGEMTWMDGNFYEGFWKNNKADGKGRLVYANGEIYEGEFKADTAHGFGTFQHKNGIKYTGNWVNNHEEGEGQEDWPSGDVFKGTFKAGYKVKGEFKWADGAVYNGEFQEN